MDHTAAAPSTGVAYRREPAVVAPSLPATASDAPADPPASGGGEEVLVSVLPVPDAQGNYPDDELASGEGIMFDVEPRIWGSPFWKHIHLVAYAYPERPTSDTRQAVFQIFDAYRFVLPCGGCREHYRELWRTYPIENYLDSRENFIAYTELLHDAVNRDLKLPPFQLKRYLNDLTGTDAVVDAPGAAATEATTAAAPAVVSSNEKPSSGPVATETRPPSSGKKEKSHHRRQSARKDKEKTAAAAAAVPIAVTSSTTSSALPPPATNHRVKSLAKTAAAPPEVPLPAPAVPSHPPIRKGGGGGPGAMGGRRTSARAATIGSVSGGSGFAFGGEQQRSSAAALVLNMAAPRIAPSSFTGAGSSRPRLLPGGQPPPRRPGGAAPVTVKTPSECADCGGKRHLAKSTFA